MDKHNRKYNTNTGLENFILRLQEKTKTISYYSGYINSESKVKLKCNVCGTIFERWASCVRKQSSSSIRCYTCEKLNTKRDKTLTILERKSSRSLDNKQITFSVCGNCGKLLIGDKKYCSKKCRDRQHEHIKSRQRINNAKNNGTIDKGITLDKLILRDNNTCYICGSLCDKEDYYYIDKYFVAGDLYPSIDHIKPLAKGGTHTWENIKLAHKHCNSLKGDKNLERVRTYAPG